MTTSISEKLRILRPYVIGGLVSVVGFVFFVLGAYTITHREKSDERHLFEPTGQVENGQHRTIIMVEGCEYITSIETQTTVYYGMAHRGLCRNPAHGAVPDSNEQDLSK